ncbi:MAG: urea carboxylase-associated family protein [Chloroflexia bacterium]|nr:urea carboxylase-associated family protein [Chloroflexia bacterium]
MPSEPSTIAVDRPLYERIAAETAGRALTHRHIVPIRAGYAWPMKAGQVCRIVAVEGPQVVDFNAWNRHNPRERFWAARTRQLESTHLTTFNRLWSVLPYLRPMLTITRETIQYGEDADGGRCHDLLGTRCDPYVTKLLMGESFDFNCHSNLTRAVLPWHLNESDVHDVLNIFQVTGLNEDGLYFMKASPANKGDYFEFLAEIDLLCAVSTCPGGDLSVPLWGPEAGDPLPTCKPIGIEVYDLPGELLAGWSSPSPSDYDGFFGLRQPV